jgi:hypothetical protein
LSRSARTLSSELGSFVTLSIAVQNASFIAFGIRSDASNTKLLAFVRSAADRLLMSSG